MVRQFYCDLSVIKLFLAIYSIAWHLALPLLKRSPRMGLGWPQRTMQETPEGPFDLWIQAASGGESMLTIMVLEKLARLLPAQQDTGKNLRVLVTSGTKQGIDSLNKYKPTSDSSSTGADIEISIAYFPFDSPSLMVKAFDRFRPRLAIIIETELWPGFLITAFKNKVPVLLINGRMSVKSFGSYKCFKSFFKKYGPEKVLAISKQDGQRFAEVMGPTRVSQINNIKFDRVEACPAPLSSPAQINNPLEGLLPENSPFILLGSIRRQEEGKILWTIEQLKRRRPDCTIGLFPKHIERADHWAQLLASKGIRAIKRSEARDQLNPELPSGTVIVWDIFGELAGAYSIAQATFVGGSLENLGGQNFLEPLVFGLKPIIGPFWKNFAWVGPEIVTSGLVQEVLDKEQLVDSLLRTIDVKIDRETVVNQVQDFLEPRKGGTQQVCQHIILKLKSLENI